VESHANRIDETTAAVGPKLRHGIHTGIRREVIPNVAVAAINLIYQPEWTRFVGTGAWSRTSTFGAALGVMAQMRPGFFLGGGGTLSAAV